MRKVKKKNTIRENKDQGIPGLNQEIWNKDIQS